MMLFSRRMILPLLFGLCGAAILVGLGVWQLQRLAWKSAVLAEIDARISAAPVDLPVTPDATTDKYLPVTATGTLMGAEAHVLTSQRDLGPGYRVLAALQTESGRQVLVDLGFVAEADLATPRPTGPLQVVGNLHWPDETDSFTPPHDKRQDIWFARDVPTIAATLQTEPFLLVARTTNPAIAAIKPLPVDSAGIANDHLEYAITWFSLAIVWLGMTGLLLWRIRQRGV
jgi:surfeit locus 1 family protein